MKTIVSSVLSLLMFFSTFSFSFADADAYDKSIIPSHNMRIDDSLVPMENPDGYWVYCGSVEYSQQTLNVITSALIGFLTGGVYGGGSGFVSAIAAEIAQHYGHKASINAYYKVDRFSLYVEQQGSAPAFYKLQEIVTVYCDGRYFKTYTAQWETPYPPDWARPY